MNREDRDEETTDGLERSRTRQVLISSKDDDLTLAGESFDFPSILFPQPGRGSSGHKVHSAGNAQLPSWLDFGLLSSVTFKEEEQKTRDDGLHSSVAFEEKELLFQNSAKKARKPLMSNQESRLKRQRRSQEEGTFWLRPSEKARRLFRNTDASLWHVSPLFHPSVRYKNFRKKTFEHQVNHLQRTHPQLFLPRSDLLPILIDDNELRNRVARYDPFRGNTLSVTGLEKGRSSVVSLPAGFYGEELRCYLVEEDSPCVALQQPVLRKDLKTELLQLDSRSIIGEDQVLIASRSIANVGIFKLWNTEYHSNVWSHETLSWMRFPTRTCHVSLGPTTTQLSAATVTEDGALYYWTENGTVIDVLPPLDSSTGTQSYDPLLWKHCEFGSHPLVLLVADTNSVGSVDLRIGGRQRSKRGLFSIRESLQVSRSERFYCMKRHEDNPYHLALGTSNFMLVIDERYPRHPLLRWAHHQSYDPPSSIAFYKNSERGLGQSVSSFFTFNSRGSEVLGYQYQGGSHSNGVTPVAPQSSHPPYCLSRMTESNIFGENETLFTPPDYQHELAGICVVDYDTRRKGEDDRSLVLYQLTKAGELYGQLFKKYSSLTEASRSDGKYFATNSLEDVEKPALASVIPIDPSTLKNRKMIDMNALWSVVKSRTFTPDCPARSADLSLEEQQLVILRIVDFIQSPKTIAEIVFHVQERCGVALKETELRQLLQSQFELTKISKNSTTSTSGEGEEEGEKQVEDRTRRIYYWKVKSIVRKQSGTGKDKGKEKWEKKDNALVSHHTVFCTTPPDLSIKVLISEDDMETIQQDRRRLLPSDFAAEQEVDFLSQLTQNDDDEGDGSEGGGEKRKKEEFSSEKKKLGFREQLSWREQQLKLASAWEDSTAEEEDDEDLPATQPYTLLPSRSLSQPSLFVTPTIATSSSTPASQPFSQIRRSSASILSPTFQRSQTTPSLRTSSLSRFEGGFH